MTHVDTRRPIVLFVQRAGPRFTLAQLGVGKRGAPPDGLLGAGVPAVHVDRRSLLAQARLGVKFQETLPELQRHGAVRPARRGLHEQLVVLEEEIRTDGRTHLREEFEVGLLELHPRSRQGARRSRRLDRDPVRVPQPGRDIAHRKFVEAAGPLAIAPFVQTVLRRDAQTTPVRRPLVIMGGDTPAENRHGRVVDLDGDSRPERNALRERDRLAIALRR